jgi:hypothetical protein
MLFRLLADLVVLVHLAFVVFVILGGFLAFRFRSLLWAHLPAVIWAGAVELSGSACPLTPLENWLRERGGGRVYRGDFIEHYVLPVLYPESLTRETQVALGLLVLALNGVLYGALYRRKRAKGRPAAQ